MTKTDKYLLGKHTWYLVCDDGISTTGVDPEWKNPDSTLADLVRVYPDCQDRGGKCFVLRQWQQVKEGRRTFCREFTIKTYALAEGGEA